ncbi:MAG: hypothetical protein ACRDD5_00935 [Silvania sp.]|uniref:hypothetical protein n=1 Tax=Silvania sp. TaxID=3016633 RepID=UPI003EE81C8B
MTYFSFGVKELVDHFLRHDNRHRHPNYQAAKFGYLIGLLHDAGVQVGSLSTPPGNIGFKAANAPLFEFTHHIPYPVMDISWQMANITTVITTTLTGGIISPPAQYSSGRSLQTEWTFWQIVAWL